MSHTFSIRPATKEQIDALVDLENACFDSDRLSRRNFQWMLSRANSSLLAAQSPEGRLLGYILVLFHRGTSLARIYSVAVSPEARGTGLGRALVEAAEAEAKLRERTYMRLEVRKDNAAAIRLYRKLGYREFETWLHYYEDEADALRFEKRIETAAPRSRIKVPYFPQTTPFTCGPAALMMAMTALGPEDYQASPEEELQLWREATTIFMTSGHGGCGPRGLALAAHARGFHPEIFLNQGGPLFMEGVRSQSKKRILQRVHEDFKRRAEAAAIPTYDKPLTLATVRELIEQGSIPLVLISSYRLYGEKAPHWVVITGLNDRFIFFNDPSVDREAHETDTDRINIPMRLEDFSRMAQFGRAQLKAAVVISNRPRGGSPARPAVGNQGALPA